MTRNPSIGLRTMIFGAVTLLFAATGATAENAARIPAEVIERAAAEGAVLVLVGLKVPWQMEANLSEPEVKAQREAIAAIQKHLLAELQGKSHRVTRLYDRVPGIGLEVGADGLAELARSPYVTNVLFDRPAAAKTEMGSAEKVPFVLFQRAADNGSVLVLAGLRAPWRREDQLSEDLIELQRQAILSAQRYVLAELKGTEFRVLRLYRAIPGIALRVGVDALKVLQDSPAVTNVVPDRPAVAR